MLCGLRTQHKENRKLIKPLRDLGQLKTKSDKVYKRVYKYILSEKFVTEIRHDMGLKTFIKRRFTKEEEIYMSVIKIF